MESDCIVSESWNSTVSSLRTWNPTVSSLVLYRFDGRKQHKGDSTKQQIDRLVHKVKREKKSAMREVRKDMAFLSKVKIDEQIKKYAELCFKTRRKYVT